MGKLKSHRGASKRFKATGSGKIKAKKAGLKHILTKKSSKSKRKKRDLVALNKADSTLVKSLVPNLR